MDTRLAQFIFLLAVGVFLADAQPGCPINFQIASTADLKPGLSSQIVLLRQNDSTYMGYEVADAAPYRVIRTTPNFHKQLTMCPFVLHPRNFLLPPDNSPLYTRLSSGGYMRLETYYEFHVQYYSAAGLDGAVLDSALNLCG